MCVSVYLFIFPLQLGVHNRAYSFFQVVPRFFGFYIFFLVSFLVLFAPEKQFFFKSIGSRVTGAHFLSLYILVLLFFVFIFIISPAFTLRPSPGKVKQYFSFLFGFMFYVLCCCFLWFQLLTIVSHPYPHLSLPPPHSPNLRKSRFRLALTVSH